MAPKIQLWKMVGYPECYSPNDLRLNRVAILNITYQDCLWRWRESVNDLTPRG